MCAALVVSGRMNGLVCVCETERKGKRSCCCQWSLQKIRNRLFLLGEGDFITWCITALYSGPGGLCVPRPCNGVHCLVTMPLGMEVAAPSLVMFAGGCLGCSSLGARSNMRVSSQEQEWEAGSKD